MNLSLLIQRIPRTAPTADLGPYLGGARIFHGAGAGQRVWLADLTRLVPNPFLKPLGNNLFVSADGKAFHELRVVERMESCILTNTPGFVAAMTVYHESTGILLFTSPPERPLEGWYVLLKRIPDGNLLREASFFLTP